MGKTKSQRQKEYRERKKAREGDKYLAKESQRVKKYYVKTSELSKKKLTDRRKRIRESMQRNRLKTRLLNESGQETAERQIINNDCGEAGPCDSTVPDTDLAGPSCLTVKLPFRTSSNQKRRRRSKALSKANKKIKGLQNKVISLNRRNAIMRKKIQRLKNKKLRSSNQESTNQNNSSTENLTPKSKTIKEINRLNITPKSRKKVQKTLEFHNSLINEIKTSVSSSQGKSSQRNILRVACGNVFRKNRLERTFAKAVGVHRKQIKKTRTGVKIAKQRQKNVREGIREQVVTFLERDDNSTCLPGKKDGTKAGNAIRQTRTLNDYLFNLHVKFLAEHSNVKVSLSVFSRMRPKYIKPVKYSNRKTCLCQKHQNMQLKCRVLKNHGIISTELPDFVVQQKSDADILNQIDILQCDKISFSEWKRVEVEKKDRKIKRMQIVPVEKSKAEFKEILRRELIEFRSHKQRVKTQYSESRKLKEQLPNNHVICHMDFAENYSCCFAEEVQSAYFDKGTVTLHPVVTYYKDPETDELKHKSCVYVSDETAHTSSTVFAIMKHIVPEVKSVLPQVQMIHYMTDSPTSQYRNQQIFSIVARHNSIFPNVKCSWLYFEAGHGKGVCDGVGGTAKRNADMAVKRHKAVIQTADDFYSWGKTQENSNLKYIYVSKSECEQAVTELASVKTKQVKGTLRVHAVVPRSPGKIAVRDTSCFCSECFSSGEFLLSCPGWVEHEVVQLYDNSTTDTDNVEVDVNAMDTGVYPEGAYVAALYEGQWYMGQILEYDSEDNEYHINFMRNHSAVNLFKWPKEPDQIWISMDDVLCSVNEPVKQGRTRSMYKFDASDLDKVKALYG